MELTANQLAELVGGDVVGNGDVKVFTFSKIEEGHEGALSFLANPKYTHFIYDTESSVVLVSRTFEPEREVKATMIRVDDPYATIARLLEMVEKMTRSEKRGIEQPAFVAEGVDVPADAYVGAFAYIGQGVKLGAGVKIYPQAYVGDGCEIGDGTVLYAGTKVYPGCKIGQRCIIHSGAVIGADGFGFAPVNGHYEKIPQMGNVEFGNDVEIGANTTVDRAMMGSTRIGDGVKLDNLIQIAHNCTVGHDTVMAAQAGIAGSCHVGASCMIGGQVGVVGHISIPDRTEIGAQSGVNRAGTAPGQRLMGAPAVDMAEYARGLVYQKRLGQLYETVDALKKELKSLKQELQN